VMGNEGLHAYDCAMAGRKAGGRAEGLVGKVCFVGVGSAWGDLDGCLVFPRSKGQRQRTEPEL
jgi:hypothetical protein